MRWGEKDNSFWCWSHSLALAARWQISVGMCLESGMRHWTRHCWLRKASLIHTVPTQFIYNIKLLIITGLCWTQRGRKRGKGPHWGKGQQGIFCLRLTMLWQMSSCCQPLAELPAEGSRLPACLRQWGIPVISLCFPAAHIIFHTADLSPRKRPCGHPADQLIPFSWQHWAEACPCSSVLWQTVIDFEVWSARRYCLSSRLHYFAFMEGNSGKQTPGLAVGLLSWLWLWVLAFLFVLGFFFEIRSSGTSKQ